MDTKPSSSKKTILILAAGACSLLVLFACGLSAVLGAGSLAWLARTRVDSRAVVRAEEPKMAVLHDLRGWVEVLEPGGSWAAAQEDQVLSAGQHVRTGALSGAALRFFDGSLATLQAGSELVIEELEAGENGTRKIILQQLAGESSHEVAPNQEDGSQYLVNTESGAGEAKGTIFNVVITPTGSQYLVTEGVVAVTALEVTVLVNAGEVTTILLGQPPLEPVLSISGQGVVTQTGEVWVIAGQSFTVTEDTVISGDPQAGDWVMVKGRMNEDGTATADWIALLRRSPGNHFSISGLVETIGETEWTVQGQVIAVGEQTEIDANITEGDLVRVDGLVLEGGAFQAERIELVADENGLRFDFTGVVQEAGDEAWLISGQEILVNENTEIEGDFAAGDVVRVLGVIDAETGGWMAESISAAPEAEPGFRISGELESIDPWQVAGLPFETRDWTIIEAGLEVGDQVRVEGRIDEQGLWIADTIERLDEESTRLVLIGTVISMDPWIISGIPLTVSEDAVIEGEIQVGMLVRVEIVLAEDGTWQVVRIVPLDIVDWFPGCIDIVATVISVSGDQIQLENWPLLLLDDGAQVEGDITPNSVVRFRVCFDDDMVIHIVYIVVIIDGDSNLPDESGEKVTVCHKPDKKKGGHTLTISRSALGGHMGHGDYIGACR